MSGQGQGSPPSERAMEDVYSKVSAAALVTMQLALLDEGIEALKSKVVSQQQIVAEAREELVVAKKHTLAKTALALAAGC